MKFPSFKIEREYLSQGYDLIIGCDEVGVGPVAGPVVAAACALDPLSIGTYRSKTKWYARVRDSKTTNETERDGLSEKIKSNCVGYAIGEVSPQTIDAINIYQATLQAMTEAVNALLDKLRPNGKKTLILLDGRSFLKNLHRGYDAEQRAIIAGDSKILSIAAASIIAKVYRDGLLKDLDQKFPQYGFAKHKGYGTAEHRRAISLHGITPWHRKSFLKDSI